jgi:hypothetical protein
MYYERDGNKWTQDVKRQNFVQHSTTLPGMDVIMLRARTTVRADIRHVKQVCANIHLRREWETVLYDLEALDVTSDMFHSIAYFAFRSPSIGPIAPAADRDFLMTQDIRMNFPEEGC